MHARLHSSGISHKELCIYSTIVLPGDAKFPGGLLHNNHLTSFVYTSFGLVVSIVFVRDSCSSTKNFAFNSFALCFTLAQSSVDINLSIQSLLMYYVCRYMYKSRFGFTSCACNYIPR